MLVVRVRVDVRVMVEGTEDVPSMSAAEELC